VIALAALSVLAAQQLDPVEGACGLVAGVPVYVTITGLMDRSGRIKVELYPANEADFLRDDTGLKSDGRPFRRVWAQTPSSDPVTVCIRAPYAGQWALLVTHDRDGRNKFNFWQDGAGFPSGGRLGRSRPKVRQALLNVGANGGGVTVRMQYLRGLGGFGPVD